MDIAENLTRIENAKADIKTAIENKGVTVGDSKIDTYASKISEIETGGSAEDYFGENMKTSGFGYNLIQTTIKKIPNFIKYNDTSLKQTFQFCENITELDLSNFDTSNTTTMNATFDHCRKLTKLDLSNFDTSKVTNMNSMFASCDSLEKIVGSEKFNTSKVLDMNSIFNSCEKLKEIPYLDTSSLKYIPYSFAQCYELTELQEFDFSNVISVTNAFIYCNNLTNIGGFKNLGMAYKTTTSSNDSNYELLFSYTPNLTHDSLMNVINKLYDIKTKGCNPQKLTLGSTNLAKLTAEEIAIATDKRLDSFLRKEE